MEEAKKPKDVSELMQDGKTLEEVVEIRAQVDSAFSKIYTADDLIKDSNRELLSLATLPSWPDDPDAPCGHGIGSTLNDFLGGGVCPGYFLLLGAASAGAGKTAFIMQVADGLALRTADIMADGTASEPLTPVIIASEMSPQALTWRTLARWTGIPAGAFRGQSDLSRSLVDVQERFSDDLITQAMQDLHDARSMTFYYSGGASGGDFIDSLKALVEDVRAFLRVRAPGVPVWPIIIIDPIQRFSDDSLAEIEADNDLLKAVSSSTNSGGWITLATSDTIKQAAVEIDEEEPKNPAQEGARAFRGTYRAQHLPDATVYLRPNYLTAQKVAVYPIKNRWGPTTYGKGTGAQIRGEYTRKPAIMRFYPEVDR